MAIHFPMQRKQYRYAKTVLIVYIKAHLLDFEIVKSIMRDRALIF